RTHAGDVDQAAGAAARPKSDLNPFRKIACALPNRGGNSVQWFLLTIEGCPMPHLTICQLSEILALSNFVRRDWNSMGNYLRLDEDDSCPERHEVESSPEYHELEEVIQRLSLEALDQLVALCLLGI